jgi:3-phosphoshikimate 1-carboxyvinyltransferase
MGCQVTATDTYTEVVGPSQLRGIDVDMNNMSDLVQTLALLRRLPVRQLPSAMSAYPLQETERIKAVVTELRRLTQP